MDMKTCANCARPMQTAQAGGVAFEQCPQCGGAWFDEDRFESLVASRPAPRSAYRPDSWIEAIGPARQVRKLLKIAAAAAVVLALLVGLGGYYVVWPLLTRAGSSDMLAKITGDVAGKQGKPLAVPSDISTWAQQTAKKTAEDALRKAAGLPAAAPAKQTQADTTNSGETENE